CHGIEVGDGISKMVRICDGLAAIKAAGFELEYHEDLAQRGDPVPWYYPIAGELKHARTAADFFGVFRMSKVGRAVMHKFIGGLETIGFAPPGTQRTADTLAVAADCLIAGAKENQFTPMYLMVARKP